MYLLDEKNWIDRIGAYESDKLIQLSAYLFHTDNKYSA